MNDTAALIPDLKLQFNIDHPSYEESYIFGYECAVLELDEAVNPYKQGSQEAEQWLEGWWDGVYGETPLFDKNTMEADDSDLGTVIAANDHQYCHKHSLLSLVFEISGAIAASAIVGYQLLELVA